MIERYSRKEIKSIWEDYSKYSIWLEIELAAAEAMEKLKIIPPGIVKKIKPKAKINVKRISKIEERVKHDVIAFLTSITEKAGKNAKYLHKGMTSSDVLDTCFNMQLKRSREKGENMQRKKPDLWAELRAGTRIYRLNTFQCTRSKRKQGTLSRSVTYSYDK